MSRGASSVERVLAIYRGNYLVAIFRDAPGIVASALRGAAPVSSDAVVSGEIRSLEEEKTLVGLLARSATVDSLLDALEDAGYRVKPTPSSAQ